MLWDPRGFMNTRLARIIWMSLVRSVIEYGNEIWGDKEMVDFEKLQIHGKEDTEVRE